MDLFNEYAEDELLVILLKTLGLNKQPWTFTRGMKIREEFWDDADVLRAAVDMTYEQSDGNRNAIPKELNISWYKNDGNVGLTKKVKLEYSQKDQNAEKRKVRQGRIDYMVTAAQDLADLATEMSEPYKTQFIQASQSIELILDHYDVEIKHYTDRVNSKKFEDAVRTESDPAILTILNLVVRPPDQEFSAGLTIKQTILHQLTGEYNP